MRTEFEKWIDETASFSSKGTVLIQEAVRCYKVNAYRGAYLFSYLAFKMTLKDRIITSSYLNNKAEWSKDIKALKGDKWESNLDHLIFKKQEGLDVFSLSDDLKTEWGYWRKKRNDCAHAKDEIFEYSEVESFWSFLKKYMIKFQVMGSEAYLNNVLIEHFKYHRTNQELDMHLGQLTTLDKEEIVKILIKLDKEITSYFKLREGIEELNGLNDFWLHIKDYSIKVGEAFFDFICRRDYLFFDRFNKGMPNLLPQVLEMNKSFVEKEIIEPIYKDCYYDNRLWYYTIELLKRLSPAETARFIDKITINVPATQPNELERSILKDYDYFESWKKRIFGGSLVGRTSEGTKYIGDYRNVLNIFIVLDNVEWDESIYKCLKNVLDWDDTRHGRIHNRSDYYRFIEFRSRLREENYSKKYEDCEKKYQTDL
ncbi:hypothetical protein [Paenibacillus amylolyticus]|uniref:hypothetical protein n=1 Tax=Paenibacillus amylolyticus TaxID=1451 RepID=UPI00339281BA